MSWLGRDLVRLSSTPSTNDEAAHRAREGAPHGLCVLADTQTRGRGRQGHFWHSPPGENIYLSCVLRPPGFAIAPRLTPPLTLAAGVAAYDLVNSLGIQASLKWPNDLLVHGRKVAGILTEMSTRGDKLEFVVLGLGLNVNTREFPPELAPIATSLCRERPTDAGDAGDAADAGRPFDREQITTSLLALLERWIDRFVATGAGTIVNAWKDRGNFLGERRRVVDAGRTLDGWVRDVDDEGALWLEEDDGHRHRIIAGEVT